jgi:hypothetical protein
MVGATRLLLYTWAMEGDEQKGTQGGPPMWMVFAIVFGLFLVGAAIVATVLALGG